MEALCTLVRFAGGGVALLPNAPKCLACGHTMCPCCRRWCDELLDDDGDGPDVCSCDETGCQYAPGEAESFLVLLDALPQWNCITTGFDAAAAASSDG
jgi:hypothetical protein